MGTKVFVPLTHLKLPQISKTYLKVFLNVLVVNKIAADLIGKPCIVWFKKSFKIAPVNFLFLLAFAPKQEI